MFAGPAFRGSLKFLSSLLIFNKIQGLDFLTVLQVEGT
jgi:hypothetical protein